MLPKREIRQFSHLSLPVGFDSFCPQARLALLQSHETEISNASFRVQIHGSTGAHLRASRALSQGFELVAIQCHIERTTSRQDGPGSIASKPDELDHPPFFAGGRFKRASMHQELWAGVELKLQHAEFHLERMSQSLEPPQCAETDEYTETDLPLEARDTFIYAGWQRSWERSFYAHFDAFLLTARCIPEIIQCCFGEDKSRDMKDWFDNLPEEEKLRRQEFRKQFDPSYKSFRELPLSKARNVSVHRTGVVPVTVSINGMFGVTYTGTTVTRVPLSEPRHLFDPSTLVPLRQPSRSEFHIGERQLFPECEDYLEKARVLIETARSISDAVHGNQSLTPPALS
jgi:hypothetical protein